MGTSSVIGGSTLTAPLQRTSILSMMISLLSVKLSPELLPMLLITTKHPLNMLLLTKLPQFMNHQKPDLLADLEEGEITGVEITEHQDQDRSEPTNLARPENEKDNPMQECE